MKKIILLVFSLLIIAGSALAADTTTTAEPRFENERTVLIMRTIQDGYPVRFMQKRLNQNFRLPYWDRIEGTDYLSPEDISETAMQALADQYKADIVVVPVVRTWVWRQYHAGFWGWYDDDEIFTECWYNLAVYTYNAKDGTLKSYSSRGSERDEASILNDPAEILTKAMDQIIEKMPYKRIPTDIEREAAA